VDPEVRRFLMKEQRGKLRSLLRQGNRLR
jgi:hypothetical protein